LLTTGVISYRTVITVVSGSTFSTIIGGGKNGNGTSATTDAATTTGANLIIVCVGDYKDAGALGTLSDSKGNTWTLVRSDWNSNNVPRISMWRCVNPTVGLSHTFTYTGPASSFPTIAFGAWSGSHATPADLSNVVTGNSPQTYPSITPSFNNELIVVCGNGYNSLSPSNPTGYNLIYKQGLVSSNSVSFGMWYLIQTTATATSPTMTFPSGGFGLASNLATLKPA
jgi:hypothetical protein